MLPFREIVKDDFDAVNQLIIDQLHSEVGLVEQIGHHLIQAGGKRLRPLLVLLAAKCCGYEDRRHIDLAVIIEFIHTATLLHDDVVDTSELRRGRFTANAQWGNAPSVLVGDFLYSRAFQMMVRLGNFEVMRILADTTNIISEGEVQQLVNVGDTELSEADYLQVIGRKTAQLFKGAARASGTLSDADNETCLALETYGWHLGIAFQLVDDALDYDGNNVDLGKVAGNDLAEGKMTLPLIQAIKCGSPEQSKIVSQAITTKDSAQFKAVIAVINDTESLKYTLGLAQQHIDKAKHCIAALPTSAYHTAMQELADFSVDRTY